ncbi:LysR family transcriptional regulator [Phascolarctobacterium sp.]|uniref:LysR family transcriptional regulator n=1 Tax=Phascolarctobacterium sp. TaxID=2049039 RepID=UPI00386DF892
MNISIYRSFLTLVQCKSFTQAARILNFSQPTISNHISALEEIYGVTLFAREGKSIYLTAAGNAFVPIAKKMVAEYESGLAEMAAFHEEGMQLKIAVSTQFINLYLIPVLDKLKKEFPELEIIVDRRMTIPDVINDTFNLKQYDFGFTHIEVQPMYSKRVRLWQQRLIWITSRQLFEEHNCDNNIYNYPLIGYGSFEEYIILMKDRVDFSRFEPGINFNDSESIIEAVRQNMGVAVVPYSKVARDLGENGPLVQIAEQCGVDVSVHLLYDLEMNMTTYRRRFVELCQEAKF